MGLETKFYVLQCCDYIKIGVSKRPQQRAKSLQTGNPFKRTLLLALSVDDPYTSEKYFHEAHGGQRGIGEWFKINASIAQWVKDMKQYEYMQNGGVCK